MTKDFKKLRLALGDQLNHFHPWFSKKDPQIQYVIIESLEEASYTKHHIQKLVGFLLAMKQFATEMEKKGHNFLYIEYANSNNRGSISETVVHLIQIGSYQSFEYQEPDEWRLQESLRNLKLRLEKEKGIETKECPSFHFYTEKNEIQNMFPKRNYLMETFYRQLRKKHNVLIEKDGGPVGGKWNFDSSNRKKYDGKKQWGARPEFGKDVSKILKRLNSIPTFGNINPKNFPWPVSRKESLALLNYFLEFLLPAFGDYQDAMLDEEPFLFHSLLSFSLNTKLLSPKEVVDATVLAYQDNPKEISLSNAEGFIRQILGWREFMRGVYWAEMPEYSKKNFFSHSRPLPSWFWTGKTKMRCMERSIANSLDHAYAHHIQRLMVIGNFSLLAGLDPSQVDGWYLGVYMDAIEWVQITNTRGMSQYADGGLVATKPYVSTSNYIGKMSNYCKNCSYNPKTKTEANSCPFNPLYWNFFSNHEKFLSKNPRIGMVYPQLNKMNKGEKKLLFDRAQVLLNRLEEV